MPTPPTRIEQVHTLTELLKLRRATWRAGSRWQTTTDGDTDQISFALLDAGPAGYWHISPTDHRGQAIPADDTPDAIRPQPIRPSQVWQLLCDLTPGIHDPATPSPLRSDTT